MAKIDFTTALENCFQSLAEGADVESCLVRYPEMAEDLRPILATAELARASAITDVPEDAMRRGKARFLQTAAELREQRQTAKAPAVQKRNFFSQQFFRLAITTALLGFFLVTSGTGLVSASRSALPGDQLYPVKRSLEDIQLFLVFDTGNKEAFQKELEHKRVKEIKELYTEKRVAEVNFHGILESRDQQTWKVGGLIVEVDEDLNLTDIETGAMVQVIGETEDGKIKAKQIILMATPTPRPIQHPPVPQQPAKSTGQPTLLPTATAPAGEESNTPATIEDANNLQAENNNESDQNLDDNNSDDGGDDNSSDEGGSD